MKLFIDADGCPVTKIAVRVANQAGIPCTVICDTTHAFDIPGVEVITVEKGTDSVDFRLVNLIRKGDIAITQDYGLAAMCLSKGALVLHQDGRQYTNENISGLLEFRAVSKKIRKSGGRLKGNPKRTAEQDRAFEMAPGDYHASWRIKRNTLAILIRMCYNGFKQISQRRMSYAAHFLRGYAGGDL